MDLAFSPDLPAWICYTVLLLVGFAVAVRKVSAGLETLSGRTSPPVWHYWRTWLLYICYLIVPLLLFWLLDRTEAIHDTSLFAALVVAFAYERIMSGQDDTIKAPTSVSGLWSPFQQFIERTRKRILEQLQTETLRFDNLVIASVLQSEKSFAALEKLAFQLTLDANALKAQLAAVPKDDSLQATKKRALILYAEVHGSEAYTAREEWQQLLMNNGVINIFTYLANSPRIGSMAGAVMGCLLTLIIAGFSIVALDHPATWNKFYLWRLSKANVTQADLFRTRAKLGEEMTDPDTAPQTFGALTTLLVDPRLSVERSDVVIALLLEERCGAEKNGFPLSTRMVDSLRTANIDIRDRINQALVFLGDTPQLPEELRSWNPAKGDSVVAVETKMNHWDTFWAKRNLRAACEASPPKAPSASPSAPTVQPAPQAPSTADTRPAA